MNSDSPSNRLVIAAMSGGVDSAVAAALLLEQGYDVIGVTMKMHDRPMDPNLDDRHRGCCTLDAASDARRVAAILGIPHYVVNFTEAFEREIIDNFTHEYLSGRTPNPCIRCNTFVKFGALQERATVFGADLVASGHYAQVHHDTEQDRWALKRGADPKKDQSYALYGLSQEQLSRTLFPLGRLAKEETRARARELGLRVANKPDSQEICFIPRNNYREFLQQEADGAIRPGPILTKEGRQVGAHQGLPLYTIGQRRGLGISWTERLYVTDLDSARNALIVGRGENLEVQSFTVTEINWVAIASPAEPISCQVKIRYKHEAAPAVVTPNGSDRASVRFDPPQRAVTPGQAAVFYSGDVVLGGGVIAEVCKANETRTATNPS